MSRLLLHFDIATPNIRLLYVSSGRLVNHPGLDPELLSAGVHLGSQSPVDPVRTSIFDYVPRSIYPSLRNRSDFVKVAILDQLVGKQDRRQAVFTRREGQRQLTAYMIDNKSVFSGASWRLASSCGRNLSFDTSLYDFAGADEISSKFCLELSSTLQRHTDVFH